MATELQIKPSARWCGATIATLEYCYLETPKTPHVTVNIRFYTVDDDSSASRTAQGAAKVELALALAGEYLAKDEHGKDYVTENVTMLRNALLQLEQEIDIV